MTPSTLSKESATEAGEGQQEWQEEEVHVGGVLEAVCGSTKSDRKKFKVWDEEDDEVSVCDKDQADLLVQFRREDAIAGWLPRGLA